MTTVIYIDQSEFINRENVPCEINYLWEAFCYCTFWNIRTEALMKTATTKILPSTY